MEIKLRGVRILKEALNPQAQRALVEDIRTIARAAPFVQPVTPGGKQMSVRMTSAGQFGWVTDRSGYRYQAHHPDGQPWPEIPESLNSLWAQLCHEARLPECCLVNYYGEGARMGLHVDNDEADFSQPVLSLSLGDDGMFRVGNLDRGGKTESHWLQSGDVALLEGNTRLIHHGVDRIRFGSSSLLPKGGRINVTMRVVT